MGVQSWYGNDQNQPYQNPYIKSFIETVENVFTSQLLAIRLAKPLQIFFKKIYSNAANKDYLRGDNRVNYNPEV